MSNLSLVLMALAGGCAVAVFLMGGYALWSLRKRRDDPPNDAGPLSTFRTSTLKDLVAHNMVMVDAEKYAVMEEMCRRFTERVKQEAAEVKQ